jgi:DNA-binding response OmpR family regulator
MKPYTILVCDDDRDIVEVICIYLKQEGYQTIKAYDGLDVLEKLKQHDIQLIVMDIMMPKLDGLQATLAVRELQNVPIILLTAKSEDTDKVIGLNFGADDYLTKPFNPLELIARVKSQLRRYTQLGSLASESGHLVTGGLVMRLEEKTVTVDDEVVNLTATEWGILRLLMQNMNKVFSIDEIYEAVWHEEAFAANNAVAVHIRRIREKIEIDPKNPKYLKVVWGIGYKIEKHSV